jgi:uncharacterized repeat protein (TIGR03803 family)
VTAGGGTLGDGVVFQATPTGKITVLYNFEGGAEGFDPEFRLIQGSDGDFYGATIASFGSFGGDVFEISQTGAYTILHALNDTTDGAQPSGVLQATDGNLYGVTGWAGAPNDGCASGCGTLFQVTSGGTYSVLHNFSGKEGDHGALRTGPAHEWANLRSRQYGP